MEIGFIGLGIMGAPMAGHLQDAGHRIHTKINASPIPAANAEKGAVAHDSLKAVADAGEIVILMVPDTPDVEAVLFGEDGVAAGLTAGKLVIDMSSISPTATKDFAARVKALGAEYLDAPVSGGEAGAKNAALTIMVGGSPAAFARARPLFEIMGKNITLVGEDNGAGQTCKVANQIIVALNIEAVAEALTFAAKAGADPAKVREALMGGFAASKVLEAHGQKMIDRAFQPGFKIKLHQKDLNLALQSAREMGMSLPNTATAQQLFSACVARGGAEWDHSAMVTALELMADHRVADA